MATASSLILHTTLSRPESFFNDVQQKVLLTPKIHPPPFSLNIHSQIFSNVHDSWQGRQWRPTPVFLPGKIPWVEEPDRLQTMGSLRVRHDQATSLSLFTFMHWRRKWQPTPVFLPGESQGWGSLVGCRLWGRTESDTTEAT